MQQWPSVSQSKRPWLILKYEDQDALDWSSVRWMSENSWNLCSRCIKVKRALRSSASRSQTIVKKNRQPFYNLSNPLHKTFCVSIGNYYYVTPVTSANFLRRYLEKQVRWTFADVLKSVENTQQHDFWSLLIRRCWTVRPGFYTGMWAHSAVSTLRLS